jgi:hypothetical protein
MTNTITARNLDTGKDITFTANGNEFRISSGRWLVNDTHIHASRLIASDGAEVRLEPKTQMVL